MLEKHACLSGKQTSEKVSFDPITGRNSLGSSPCLMCSSDSYWDYWHLRWNHDQMTIAGGLASLAINGETDTPPTPTPLNLMKGYLGAECRV